MDLNPLSNLKNLLPEELIQTFEIMIIFIFLYGIIFLLLTTSEKRKFFQKQK